MKTSLSPLVWICFAAISIWTPSEAFADHSFLDNGDFATGIEGWHVETDAGFDLTWDGSTGQPAPGSLQLSGAYVGVGFPTATALSECIEVTPGSQLILEAQVYGEVPDGGIRCIPFLARYSGPRCTGERGHVGSGASTLTPDTAGVWRDVTLFNDFSVGPTSFRVALFYWRLSGFESASCRFDSVVLYEEGDSPSVTEIPTTDEVGLIAMMVLLGLLAPWWIGARLRT